ncbi:MAG: type II secretion system protein [Thermotaleaceae bacterium]
MIRFFSKKIKNKKGFTLIELVVVIAILGILAGIAVPRFSNVSADAQKTADEATARTIASAVTMAAVAKNPAGQPTDSEINNFLNDIKVGVTTTGAAHATADWTVAFTDTTTTEFKIFKKGESAAIYPK